MVAGGRGVPAGGPAGFGDVHKLPIEVAGGERGIWCMWGMLEMPRSDGSWPCGRFCTMAVHPRGGARLRGVVTDPARAVGPDSARGGDRSAGWRLTPRAVAPGRRGGARPRALWRPVGAVGPTPPRAVAPDSRALAPPAGPVRALPKTA